MLYLWYLSCMNTYLDLHCNAFVSKTFLVLRQFYGFFCKAKYILRFFPACRGMAWESAEVECLILGALFCTLICTLVQSAVEF